MFYTSVVVFYLVGVLIYRRYFHPLAAIPGPTIASVTKLYQTYFAGKYFEHIGRLHGTYGPIVRICPNEIHLSDPELYDKIYYVGTNYTKDPVYYNATNVPLSTFGMINTEVRIHPLVCSRSYSIADYPLDASNQKSCDEPDVLSQDGTTTRVARARKGLEAVQGHG